MGQSAWRLILRYPMPLATVRTALESINTLETSNGSQPLNKVDQIDQAGVRIGLAGLSAPGFNLWERYYAVVVPFNTLQDDISLDELQQRWTKRQQSADHARCDVA